MVLGHTLLGNEIRIKTFLRINVTLQQYERCRNSLVSGLIGDAFAGIMGGREFRSRFLHL